MTRLAIGQRITTRDELEAAPHGTIIRDSDGQPWLRTGNPGHLYWITAGTPQELDAGDIPLPATLLHLPEDNA